MTKEELKIKVEKCFEHSVELLEKQGSLEPMLDIEFTDDTGNIGVIAVVIGGVMEHRQMFIQGLGTLFGGIKSMNKIKEMRCIVMMNEGWASRQEELKMSPSQDPKRREIIMAAGLNLNGDTSMVTKEIVTTVVVKGKRYFTLQELTDFEEERKKEKGIEKIQSPILENFFTGYKQGQERAEMFKSAYESSGIIEKSSLADFLEIGVKKLVEVMNLDKKTSVETLFKN